MNVLDKLYVLVKTFNMNDDNEEKYYDVSTDLITKLTFFIIIGGKASTNISLSKMHCLKKCVTLTCLYYPMYLELDEYPPEILNTDIEFLKLKN